MTGDYAPFTSLDKATSSFKAFVDQWLHISMENGSYKKIYGAWFN